MQSNWSIERGTQLSYNTPNKSCSNKASEEAVRVAGARFSGRVTARGDSTSGRCTALAFPSGLPGVVPLVRGPDPLPGPQRTQWRPELPPLGPRAASAPPARAAGPGPRTKETRGLRRAPRSPSPARPPGASAGDPAPARRCASRARRGAGPPTASGSHRRGLSAVGARARGHSLSRWSRAAGAPAAGRGPLHPSGTPAGSPPGPRWSSWATPAPPR